MDYPYVGSANGGDVFMLVLFWAILHGIPVYESSTHVDSHLADTYRPSVDVAPGRLSRKHSATICGGKTDA
jgi:hypothetical protein